VVKEAWLDLIYLREEPPTTSPPHYLATPLPRHLTTQAGDMRKLSIPEAARWPPTCRHGGAAVAGYLDFSASINPLGPPASVLAALRDSLSAVARYPDPACRTLTGHLARLHGVARECVVPGNGAAEVIHAAAGAVRPRRIAVLEPTFTEYRRASLRCGAAIDHWLSEKQPYRPRPFDPEGAEIVWLCNPNNPTGQLWPPGEIEPWVAARPGTVFVVDEAFLPFRRDEARHSLASAVGRLRNLIVLRSLTKVYALPGLRLGYALAGPPLAERLREQLPPWSVNALAQVAGLAALEDDLYLERTHAWLETEPDVFFRGLRDLDEHLEALPTQANFILLRLRHGTAGLLARRLAERRILVRDASDFVGLDETWVRVAVRSAAENGRLLEDLLRAVSKRGQDL
jgi:threonine-phosphate decarboxylase